MSLSSIVCYGLGIRLIILELFADQRAGKALGVKRLQIIDRFAYADGGRVSSSFDAVLVSGRVIYDITENWDIGVLGSTFRGQSGANQYAYGLEVGRLLRQNLWLSVGYNATGFRGDDDLTGYEYTQQGAFIRLRFKFDEDLFRREDARYRDPVR